MGNKSSQNKRSKQSSTSYSNQSKSSYTDSRQYSKTDARQYSKTDSRSYQNVDSRDMSTTVNNVDNRNISDIALDCGVSASDVENYTNDESININQDNSQNIIVSGDGNTLENINQKMNLTSYGPSVQKCMQKAVSDMSSANKTDLSAESSNTTATSDNSSANTSTNTSDNTSRNSTEQKSDSSQSSSQGNTQKSSSKQTAGFMSGSGGNDFLIIVLILLIAGYLLYPNKFTQLENNYKLQIVLVIYTISYFLI